MSDSVAKRCPQKRYLQSYVETFEVDSTFYACLAVRAFVCDACSPTLLRRGAAQDLVRNYYGCHDR